jgi:predicted nucleotidyltransferase
VSEAFAFPEARRAERLSAELCAVLARVACVARVGVFGSRARGEADRWSDIDLLVITRGGVEDYWAVFTRLRAHKRVVHHHVFIAQARPAGGSVLGILFVDESVFHNVDLNFMSAAEAGVAGNLARFGPVRWMHERAGAASPSETTGMAPPDSVLVQHPDDKRIGEALHWTKKAVKKYQRGQGPLEEVAQTSARLADVMHDFPEDVPLPTGNLCQAARIYLHIAGHLIGR